MSSKTNSSFVLQMMSGLVSDVDTACIVLDHTSTAVFQHISNCGIESFDSEWLEQQLGILRHCLGVLTRDKDCHILSSHDGSGDSKTGQSMLNISNICTNLLDRLCCPVLDHAVSSEVSSGCSDGVVSGVLSLLVSCFSLLTHEAQMKVSRMLISLLHNKETSSFHLPVVRVLSQLYESRDNAAAFEQLATGELLNVIEELCLTASESFTGKILVQLVPSVLMHCNCREVFIARLWSVVERCYSVASEGCVARCCFLICCLIDAFFTPSNASTSFSSNLLSSSILWDCVQKGLRHSASLTRKRAIFILRRALDFAGMIKISAESTESMAVGDSSDLLNSIDCLTQLTSVWRYVIILFETLEEKQVSLSV